MHTTNTTNPGVKGDIMSSNLSGRCYEYIDVFILYVFEVYERKTLLYNTFDILDRFLQS